MFLINNRDRILKYKSEVIQVNPELIAKVAEMAGCTVEEIEKAVDQYFLLRTHLNLVCRNGSQSNPRKSNNNDCRPNRTFPNS